MSDGLVQPCTTGVQNADIQPTDDKRLDHIAIDETVIHLNDQRYRLYAAVDPVTDEFPHLRPFATRNEGVTSNVLSELTEKYDIEDTVFLVESGPWLKAALHRHGLRFRHETHGNRNDPECVFQEIKRRTYQFRNYFRNAEPTPAETWLQSYAYCWNQLI